MVDHPSESSSRLAALRKAAFLADLDPAALAGLAAACRPLDAPAGAAIFEEGEPCEGMFVLLSGRAKIYRSSPSGREQIIAIESAVTTMAELPLLDGGSYPASCAALEDCRLLLVPRAAFEELLRRRPEVALGALRVAGRRLRQLVGLVDELSLLEVPQRLAKYLLAQAERAGPSFTLTQSNQEIASRLGTVRELVSRNLHRFQQEGAIRIEGRRIEILDREALRAKMDEGR